LQALPAKLNLTAATYRKDISELVWSRSIPASKEIPETLQLLRDFIKNFDEIFPPNQSQNKANNKPKLLPENY